MTKPKTIKEPCRKCGKPAVAYWPNVDIDIESLPYCRECLDREKVQMMIDLDNILQGGFEEEEVEY